MSEHKSKVWKAFIYPDDVGKVYLVDVIRHQNAFWLVPEWLEAPAKGFRMPRRLIRMDGHPYRVTPESPNADFEVSIPIPRAVLEGRDPSSSAPGFVVVDLPDGIRRPLAKAPKHH